MQNKPGNTKSMILHCGHLPVRYTFKIL